jgi:hypothetical protein
VTSALAIESKLGPDFVSLGFSNQLVHFSKRLETLLSYPLLKKTNSLLEVKIVKEMWTTYTSTFQFPGIEMGCNWLFLDIPYSP